MTDPRKRFIEQYILAYNQQEVEGMLLNLHNEVVFENISNGEVSMRLEGKSEFEAQAKDALKFFTEREQIVTRWTFEEDLVKVDLRYRAIAAMDFPNGIKSGDTIELQGQSEFTFAEGKIISLRDIA